jgi:hypothetical protein
MERVEKLVRALPIDKLLLQLQSSIEMIEKNEGAESVHDGALRAFVLSAELLERTRSAFMASMMNKQGTEPLP